MDPSKIESRSKKCDSFDVNVLLIGDTNTGKTFLIKSFYELDGSKALIHQPGIKSYTKQISIKNQKIN